MSAMIIFRQALLPLATMLLCVSCGPQQPEAASLAVTPEFPIHIQLSESHDYKSDMPFTSLTDRVADIRYIPLETGPDCLIGRATVPQLTEDFIFVAVEGILLQFDRQGRFIRRINKQGKGPGECTVRSFGIDEKSRLLYLFDRSKRNVNSFTFEGDYVSTLRNPFAGAPDMRWPEDFVYDKTKGNLIFTGFEDGSGNEQYKYVVIDTAGTILYKCPNYAQYHLPKPSMSSIASIEIPTGVSSRLYRYKDSYYYRYNYNDTIFMINEDYTCSPIYIRSLRNRRTIKDVVELGAKVRTLADMYGQNTYGGCYEDERYLYLFHAHLMDPSGISLLSLYDKASGTLIENINPEISLWNNWDGGMDFPLNSYRSEDHQICLMLQPLKMQETLTEEHFSGREIAHPDKAEALKQLVSTLKEEDNPVLIIITLK